ncbi:type I-A CRISPR-associated protein Cas4/Csa1 [Archaeoglobales archaeon]|nr:MAG: type I-A CRISPR-associated protein Cas4/Csa1 [Archaeoglobales archaeon]
MFLYGDIEKRVRALRRGLEVNQISGELRGYSWERPPIEPINDVKISVSDINGICPTKRDVYVKYILKEKPKLNQYMLRGLAYHKVIRDTIASLKKAVYHGCDTGERIVEEFFFNTTIPEKICKRLGVDLECSDCFKLYRYIVLQVSAKVDEILSKYPDIDVENIVGLALPPFVERKIDGSLVGLSKFLSLDVYTPHSIVMDFKSGYERDEHLLSLTGYALALEADDEVDVNFGFLIYIRINKNVHFNVKGFVVSDELRREFLEMRDEIAELVDSGIDPGKPTECPKYCSYYGVCNEGDN